MSKSAMVTVCGRPNVGKSTLINSLVGEKIAIVSPKPQTTRNRILGVVNHGELQLILVDTPGFIKPRNKLGDYMVNIVKESITDVDCALFLAEPLQEPGPGELALAEQLKQCGVPAILAINKIDMVPDKGKLLAVIAAYSQLYDFSAVVPISGLMGDGLDELLEEIEKFAEEGPHLFPDDMITDQPERQICAELIREKLLQCIDKEIPHGTAVEIDRFSERDNGIIDIEATIYTEKSSHKGIIIGKNGAMLKKIGGEARQDMEDFLGTKVYLQTWVKVKENWRDNEVQLKNFGFMND